MPVPGSPQDKIDAFCNAVLKLKGNFSVEHLAELRMCYEPFFRDSENLKLLLVTLNKQYENSIAADAAQKLDAQGAVQWDFISQVYDRIGFQYQIYTIIRDYPYDAAAQLEAERGTFIKHFLDDLEFVQKNLSEGLFFKNQFIDHHTDVIEKFECCQNILNFIFAQIRLLILTTPCQSEKTQLLSSIEYFMSMDYYSILIKLAQGQIMSKNFFFTESASFKKFTNGFKTTVPVTHASLQEMKTRVKARYTSLNEGDKSKRLIRKRLIQVLNRAEEFALPKFKTYVKGNGFHLAANAAKAKSFLNLQSQKLSEIKKIKKDVGVICSCIRLLVLFRTRAYDNDLEVWSTCKAIAEYINKLIQKRPTSLITNKIIILIEDYISKMEPYKKFIEANPRVPQPLLAYSPVESIGLQQERAALEQEKAVFVRERAAFIRDRTALEKRLAETNRANSDLQGLLKDKMEEVTALKEQLIGLVDELAACQSTEKTLYMTFANLQAEVFSYEKKLEAQRAETLKKAEELEKTAIKNTALKLRNKKLKEKILSQGLSVSSVSTPAKLGKKRVPKTVDTDITNIKPEPLAIIFSASSPRGTTQAGVSQPSTPAVLEKSTSTNPITDKFEP